MATDHIRYDLLAQDALRGVLKRVLIDAGRVGLPGEHHFYISFNTRHPGVRISPRLAEKYPEEITIVLQHQFWDLLVDDRGFEVGLSFGGVPEKLVVPFEAVSQFFDPSVQFGLKFEVIDETAAQDAAPAPALTEAAERKPGQIAALGAPAADTPPDDDAAPPAEGEEQKIVSLDTFRKKR